jgi:sorbitol/mannitol transport system substrate-binding protein
MGATSALAFAAAAQAQDITIATVNNGQMIQMQGLTGEFNKAHPDINVNWVTLEENILRERVTTDIATGGGQYDIITIGNYEVPIWGKQDWLVPLEFSDDYNVDDMLWAASASMNGSARIAWTSSTSGSGR